LRTLYGVWYAGARDFLVMIKQPSGERTDARNAHNRRAHRPYPQAHMLPIDRQVPPPCACPVYPLLRLYGIEPWTLLRQQAPHDPYSSFAAALSLSLSLSLSLFDFFSVVLAKSQRLRPPWRRASKRFVPDENHRPLASRLELSGAPRKKARRVIGLTGLPSTNLSHVSSSSGTYRESVAAEGLRLLRSSLATDC
jgi:hypothetical protein